MTGSEQSGFQPSASRVLLTGATGGLGQAIAVSLAKAGYELLLLGRDESRLVQTKARVAKAAKHVEILRCDLNQDSEIRRVVAQVQQSAAPVDILINNAGIAEAAPFVRGDMSQWERAMRVNARAPALLTAELLPAMKARGFGRIVNMGSVVSLEGARYVSAYAASKHALVGWARCLALELAGSGVTVNTLCPGYVHTSMFERARDAALSKFDGDVARCTAALLQSAGQSRLLSPQEVAQWVLRLVQDPGGRNGESIRVCP